MMFYNSDQLRDNWRSWYYYVKNIKNSNIEKRFFYVIYSWERWQSKLTHIKILNNKTILKIQLGGPVVIIVTNYRRLWRRSIVIHLNFGLPKIVYCWLVHEGGPIRPLTNLDFFVLTILYYIMTNQCTRSKLFF